MCNDLKSEKIQFRTTSKIKEDLKKHCAANNITISNLIDKLIIEEIKGIQRDIGSLDLLISYKYYLREKVSSGLEINEHLKTMAKVNLIDDMVKELLDIPSRSEFLSKYGPKLKY